MRQYFPKPIRGWWLGQHITVRVATVVILVGFAAFAMSRLVGDARPDADRTKLAAYAEQVVTACASAPFAPSCYDEEIPKLMDAISMEDAFEVTKLVQEHDPRYRYCHVLSHNLSYREAGKNLDAWKDVITRCPATFCNNGCLHGALMRRFNAETLTDAQVEALKPEIADICEPRGTWHPAEVERSMCYHAIGHLAMYVTGADMTKSSALCRSIGEKPDGRNYIQTCTEGVFMQIYQPLEPEDEALVKGLTPGRDGVASFCEPYRNANAFSYDACRREAWPLFRDELFRPAGLAQFCSYTTDPIGERTCYSTVLNMVTVYLLIEKRDFSDASDYCTALPTAERQSQCFANMATRLIQIDPRYVPDAILVCKNGEEAGRGEECFRDLTYYATFSFHAGSPAFREYCGALPEPHRGTCLALGERP
ncbi:MAG: hypothetical protein Q8R35_00890 [bacterium]|nr:hypothetical protein [bacterium]